MRSEASVETQYQTRKGHLQGRDETDSFDYYCQDMKGESPEWKRMMRDLVMGNNRRRHITGVVFTDDLVVWSDNARKHDDLGTAMGRPETEVVGRLEITDDGDSSHLTVVGHREGEEQRIIDYLRRNIAGNLEIERIFDPRALPVA